jgi:hypothetical protein
MHIWGSHKGWMYRKVTHGTPGPLSPYRPRFAAGNSLRVAPLTRMRQETASLAGTRNWDRRPSSGPLIAQQDGKKWGRLAGPLHD